MGLWMVADENTYPVTQTYCRHAYTPTLWWILFIVHGKKNSWTVICTADSSSFLYFTSYSQTCIELSVENLVCFMSLNFSFVGRQTFFYGSKTLMWTLFCLYVSLGNGYLCAVLLFWGRSNTNEKLPHKCVRHSNTICLHTISCESPQVTTIQKVM